MGHHEGCDLASPCSVRRAMAHAGLLLPASRPRRRNSAADSELAQLRAENARLSATVAEQAVDLAALGGKAAWG